MALKRSHSGLAMVSGSKKSIFGAVLQVDLAKRSLSFPMIYSIVQYTISLHDIYIYNMTSSWKFMLPHEFSSVFTTHLHVPSPQKNLSLLPTFGFSASFFGS